MLSDLITPSSCSFSHELWGSLQSSWFFGSTLGRSKGSLWPDFSMSFVTVFHFLDTWGKMFMIITASNRIRPGFNSWLCHFTLCDYRQAVYPFWASTSSSVKWGYLRVPNSGKIKCDYLCKGSGSVAGYMARALQMLALILPNGWVFGVLYLDTQEVKPLGSDVLGNRKPGSPAKLNFFCLRAGTFPIIMLPIHHLLL